MGPKKKKKAQNLFGDEDEEAERLAAIERAKQQRLEEERIRVENEKELKRLREVRLKIARQEKFENKIRMHVLSSNCLFFQNFTFSQFEKDCEERKEKVWNEYKDCLQPFPYDPRSLNSFVSYFHEDDASNDLKNVNASCQKIVNILERVDAYITHPLYLSSNEVNSLIEVKEKYCNEVIYKYDCATFQAIMDVEKYFDKLQFWKTELFREDGEFLLWLWGWAVGEDFEKRKKNIFKFKMPKRRNDYFSVRIPRNLKYQRIFLRIIRIPYDIYSWRSPSYAQPENSDIQNIFFDFELFRYNCIEEIKKRSNEFEKTLLPWWYLEVYPVFYEPPTEKSAPRVSTFRHKGGAPEEKDPLIDIKLLNDIDQEINSLSIDKYEPSIEYYNLINPNSASNSECNSSLTNTPFIVYSNSMLISREKDVVRRKLKDVEKIFFLKHPDKRQPLFIKKYKSSHASPDRSSESDEDKKFQSEKNTMFRATLYSGALENKYEDSLKYLKAFNKVIDESDESEEEQVTKAGRRIFLDWDKNELILEEVREKYLDFVFEKKDSAHQSSKARSLRQLLDESKNTKPIVDSEVDEILRNKQKKSNLVSARNSLNLKKKGGNELELSTDENLLVIKTPAQFKALEDEINSIVEITRLTKCENYVLELTYTPASEEVNLRKFHILGGIFFIDLIRHEPQPKINQDGLQSQLHFGDYKIVKFDYSVVPQVHFDAAVAAERQIRESRESARSSASKVVRPTAVESGEVELEDDDTIHVTLKLCIKAIWFSEPFLVMWDDQKKIWTKENLYDVDYKPDENAIFFKLGKSSQPLAVACRRWSLLPFKEFNLFPSETEDMLVTLSLSLTKNKKLEFEIRPNSILLKPFDHPDAPNIKHLFGVKYAHVHELVKDMRKCNLDIFPEWDTFLYVSGSIRKLKALEEHLYKCFALASPSYCFRDSPWNADVDEMSIVFYMKKVNHANYDQFMSTPTHFYVIPEDILYINDIKKVEFSTYYPDLKNYIERSDIEKEALERIQSASSKLIANVYNILLATKVLSFT